MIVHSNALMCLQDSRLYNLWHSCIERGEDDMAAMYQRAHDNHVAACPICQDRVNGKTEEGER